MAVGHLWRQQVPEWASVNAVFALRFPKLADQAIDHSICCEGLKGSVAKQGVRTSNVTVGQVPKLEEIPLRVAACISVIIHAEVVLAT